MSFNSAEIEKKCKEKWEQEQTNQVLNDPSKEKFYVLDMFPYPSGAGLHVGHPLGYIASDIFARYKRQKGYNVLHPMGFDAFGLPAEQYALQMGIHPAKSTAENIVRYRSQMENLGLNFDWGRQVNTSDPNYYKWTQWIFIQLFNHYYDLDENKAQEITKLISNFESSGTANVNAFCGEETSFTAEEWNNFTVKEKDDILMNYRLAYRKISYVNWCEALGTVLANDEIKDGVSERGGYPVEKKAMKQWSLRVLAYAERLLKDLDTVDWSDSLKIMQKNWIGRSTGAQVFFEIEGHNEKIEIFTTRPDTIFGATFMVLAPEHDLVAEITKDKNRQTVDDYIKYVNTRSERDRLTEVKETTGVFTGAYAIHPFSGERIPIWIGEYVLKDYGTGAIMAVPSDDDRDHAFATKYELPIVEVVDRSAFPNAKRQDKVGSMINSDFLNGMKVKEAISTMIDRLESENIGKGSINYKMRDANFSRQRYWGEPFPIYYTPEGETKHIPIDQLPLELPFSDNYKPTADGKAPLARLTDWVNMPDGSIRETDTMPGFAGSSWYFLRYMDPGNPETFASPDSISYWKDVDLYVGGTEHAVGHLMYSRFWHKFLYDKSLVPTQEPFKKLINQGMIQGVIEFIYLDKEKKDGYSRFLCADIVDKQGDDNFAKIPVHIDFVQEYGQSFSFLNINSIDKFIEWRPEYKDAIFECGKGIYHKGQFTGYDNNTDSNLITKSEVGKMSKRYFNVVNPDTVIDKYGADCFRMYEMFLGPVEQSKPWDTNGIDGVSKFLRKYWNLFYNENNEAIWTEEPATKAELKVLHTCLKKLGQDIEKFSFNTCVSALMVCVNDLKKLKCQKLEILKVLNSAIAPFAPFISENIWVDMGQNGSIHNSPYPAHNEKFLEEDSVLYPVSINGKKRAEMEVEIDASKDEIEQKALGLEAIQKWTEGKEIRRVIVVPKKMVNIVV